MSDVEEEDYNEGCNVNCDKCGYDPREDAREFNESKEALENDCVIELNEFGEDITNYKLWSCRQIEVYNQSFLAKTWGNLVMKNREGDSDEENYESEEEEEWVKPYYSKDMTKEQKDEFIKRWTEYFKKDKDLNDAAIDELVTIMLNEKNEIGKKFFV